MLLSSDVNKSEFFKEEESNLKESFIDALKDPSGTLQMISGSFDFANSAILMAKGKYHSDVIIRGLKEGSVFGNISKAIESAQNYFPPEVEYDVDQDPQIIGYERFKQSHLWNSQSSEETRYKIKQINQFLEDITNPSYHIAKLVGELSDPSTWLFGGYLARGAKAINAVKKTSKLSDDLKKSAKLLVAEEAVKQAVNPEREYEDALIMGGTAWYLNKLGNKFAKYEDYDELLSNMKFYETASDNEILRVISKPTSDAMYARQAKNIDEAIANVQKEFPNLKINMGKGVGKTVNNVYIPAYLRREPGTNVARLNLDIDGIKQMYKDKRYLTSRVPGVKPYKEGDFANEGEFTEFVVRHELAHVRFAQNIGETKAAYENRINKIAYDQIIENRTGKSAREGSIFVDQQKVDYANSISEVKYKNRINKDIDTDAIKLTPTGIMLEKIGYNPLDRLINKGTREAKEYSLNMLKNSLFLDANKLAKGEMPDSVEAIKSVVYRPLLNNFIDEIETLYKEYNKRMGVSKWDLKKKVEIKLGSNKEILTYQQFKNAVPYAILRGYRYPEIPEIEAAARAFKNNLTKPFGDKINALGTRFIQLDKELQFFTNGLKKIEPFHNPKSELFNPTKNFVYTYPRTGKKITYTKKQLEEKVEDLTTIINEVKKGTRDKYFPIIWNFERILVEYDKFYAAFYPRIINKKNVTDQKAKDMLEGFKNYGPYDLPLERMEGVLPGDEFIFAPSGYSNYLKSRNIPLDEVDYEFALDNGWIMNDITVMAANYYRSTATDIILTEKFGDPFAYGYLYDDVPGLAPGLRQVQESFDKIAKGITDKKELAQHKKKEKQVLKDAEAVRDLAKGTYGLAKNPQRLMSKAGRAVTVWNTLDMLSGALAGLPDIARIITYNGFKRSMPQVMDFLKSTTNGTVKELFKAGKEQANRAGQAIEFFLDTGRANMIYGSHHDTQATFNAFDRFLQNAAAFNFKYVNQMASYTYIGKSIAAITIGTDIINSATKFAKTGKISDFDLVKFQHAGVSPKEIKDIAKFYEKYGEVDEKSPNILLANSDKWVNSKDEINAAFRFNRMLNESIDYTITTPTLGDVPLWTNTELGRVIAQFKKFMFAFDRKVMQRGLQQKDATFISEIAALLFLGMVVDGIRTEQRGKNYNKKDIRDKVYDGFERSGAGGIFLEVNRMIETLSDNNVGIRPLIGTGKPYGTSLAWKAGTLGPTASKIGNISRILYDWGRGKHTHHTARRIRKLVPFNNIWYLDNIFDKFEKGIR
jgi:hypothetical protein